MELFYTRTRLRDPTKRSQLDVDVNTIISPFGFENHSFKKPSIYDIANLDAC